VHQHALRSGGDPKMWINPAVMAKNAWQKKTPSHAIAFLIVFLVQVGS
jgi:hypothetical protein